jgi:hypothetical protein
MDGKIEQQIFVKLGKPTAEILEMLRWAFEEYSLNQTAVFE